MGWSFACDKSHGRKELIAELLRPSRFGPNIQLLQACAVGNHHWYLAKTGDTIWIGLDLMQGGGRTSGWGYKSMSESSGPCAVDCPISYLDKASPATGYAIEWRRQVRERHAALAAVPTPAPGLVITYCGVPYTLISPLGRKGWVADRVSDGYRFRLKVKQVSYALRNTP